MTTTTTATTATTVQRRHHGGWRPHYNWGGALPTAAGAVPLAAAAEAVGAVDAEERWLDDGGRAGGAGEQGNRDHQPARTTRVVPRARPSG